MQDVMVALCLQVAGAYLCSKFLGDRRPMAAGFDRYSQVMQDIELHDGLRCTGAALVH